MMKLNTFHTCFACSFRTAQDVARLIRIFKSASDARCFPQQFARPAIQHSSTPGVEVL